MLIDLWIFLLQYLPAIVLGLPVMIWLYRQHRTEPQWRIVMAIVIGATALLALFLIASHLPIATRYVWSGGRLAPAVAWMCGYELYYPAGEGPVLVQMYGPVSAMVYAFTALASGPTAAILMGAFVNLLLFVLPAIWFLVRSQPGQSRLIVAAGIVLFLVISSRNYVLARTAGLVTIDAPAAGLAACAFAMLAGGVPGNIRRSAILCGVFAAASMWTKLTFAPVCVALAVYALLILEGRQAIRFVLWMGTTIGSITGLFLLWFGRELIFQNVIVPASQPWTRENWDRETAYLRGMYEMWDYVWPVEWLLLIGIILVCVNGRGAAVWREWARRNAWLAPAIAAVLVFPTATLAYVKIGGIWNNAAAPAYFGLLAAAGALMSVCGDTGKESLAPIARLSRATIVMVLLAAWWIVPSEWSEAGTRMRLWADLWNNDHQQAYDYARSHPGEAYFPGFPLATLMAEGRVDHFQSGIESMVWAGYPPTEQHYKAFLPPKLNAVVFFPVGPPPYVWPHLEAFNVKTEVEGLRNWWMLTRDGNVP